MESKDDKNVNLKQFKGHHRKFPWRLLLKVIFMVGFLTFFILLTNRLVEAKSKVVDEENEIEIEF